MPLSRRWNLSTETIKAILRQRSVQTTQTPSTTLKSPCVWHSCPATRNEAVDMSGKGNVAGFLYLQLSMYIYIYMYIHIYIYIYIYSPAPGRIYVAAGGAYNLSLLVYMVNVYCDFTSLYLYVYIYIYIYFFIVSINRWCFCTADAFHNKIRTDSSEQVCGGIFTLWL